MQKSHTGAESHRDAAFGKSECKYFWCLHCERAYENGQWREEGELQMCPYDNCDGDAVLDAWEWSKIREEHPDYPEVPEIGKSYPLYK